MANGIKIPTDSSSWISLGNDAYYQVVNGTVFVRFVTGTSDGWTTLATLPEAYRPSYNIYFGVYSGAFGYVGANDGTIQSHCSGVQSYGISTMVSYPLK